MKSKITPAIFAIGLMILMLALIKSPAGHTCKWDKCPYKGIQKSDWSKFVIEYTGEQGTDAYYIDMLHLEYPADSYDQLEEKLFKK